MTDRLAGKTALITGGSEGLGFAIAQKFVAHGARVALMARTPEKLEKAVATIGPAATAIVGDVSKMSDIQSAVEAVGQKFGSLDILVCNAGSAKNTPIRDVDEKYFDDMIGLNLKGALFTVKYCLPVMRSPGSIILVSSVTNKLGLKGQSIYAASKAALRSLSRTLGHELAAEGIRVNTLSPGITLTPLVERSIAASPEAKARYDTFIKSKTPLQRMGDPEEVANAALYLASEESSYTTGSEIFVDGGMGQV